MKWLFIVFFSLLFARAAWAVGYYSVNLSGAHDLRIIPLVFLYGEPQTINEEE